MGFTVHVNNILRYEIAEPLVVGQERTFTKDGLTLVVDDMQIWLAKKDWTALADIQVTSQTRQNGKTTGTFVVKHVYDGDEQRILTAIFKRMYGWE